MIKKGTLIFFILLAGCSKEQDLSFTEIMTAQEINITKMTIRTVTENGAATPENQIEISTNEKMQSILTTLNDFDFQKTKDPETMQKLQNQLHTPGNIHIYFEKERQSSASENNEFFGLTAYKEEGKATLYTEDGSETYYYSNIDFSKLKHTVHTLEK